MRSFINFDQFFYEATGERPYPYQQRLAATQWPDTLWIPTGLGKTAAIGLAWLWKRFYLPSDHELHITTPRRLIWCEPMRVLVEQTANIMTRWIRRLDLEALPDGEEVSIHILMGGESNQSWVEHPERETIVIGTQDMLLSRALMRGYGMSRYLWPMHYAVLHNDALWVLDEIQLMGAGLPTSAQLEAFRREYHTIKPSHTIWVSATMNTQWLNTADFATYTNTLKQEKLTPEEISLDAVAKRVKAKKTIFKANSHLTTSNVNDHIKQLIEEIIAKHISHTTTLIIVNQVEQAQEIYKRLHKSLEHASLENYELLLIHSHFRLQERKRLEDKLTNQVTSDRFIVATQAIEAGVDISSHTLFTYLAPWASLVQRFGRCNRYGEIPDGSKIYWIDIEADTRLALPYEINELNKAREKLMQLTSASPMDLPTVDSAAPIRPVLRRRDFLDLFNTDSDITGFDVDISDYIRDSDHPPVQVFWREFSDTPSSEMSPPSREELCPTTLNELNKFKGMKWIWDSLTKRWSKINNTSIKPGMIILLNAADGGYNTEVGFRHDIHEIVPISTNTTSEHTMTEVYDGDWRSIQKIPIELSRHLTDAEQEAINICNSLDLNDEDTKAIIKAALWHDVGKAHSVFQTAILSCEEMSPDSNHNQLWAKSKCQNTRYERQYFRHELASALAWLQTHQNNNSSTDDSANNTDLIAYLIAAHHGKVRMSLRAMPSELAADNNRRYARGIWEGDILPQLIFGNEYLPPTELTLVFMELGTSDMGPSWTTRTYTLLEKYGPFKLAWLEAIVRLADWRASSHEQIQI